MTTFIDKSNSIEKALRGESIKIELGCGGRKRDPASIGVDILDLPGVDVVGDAIFFLSALPSNSVSQVTSYHVLEHIQDLPGLLAEIVRVLAPGGSFFTTVPHFSNAFFYSDPTHKTFFGLYTYNYFFESEIFRRSVPSYARIAGASLIDVALNFRSYQPHYLSHFVRKLIGFFVNSNYFFMEIYEESFSGLISCYEITYTVRKNFSH